MTMLNELPKKSQPRLKTVEENVNCPVAHLLVLLVWEAWLTGIPGTNASLICTDTTLLNFETVEAQIIHNEI